MRIKRTLLAFGAGIMATVAVPALALDEITVAYFLEWPTANQVAQVEKTYDTEMGVELDWRAFGNGNEMTQAMVSGDVHIAYSQGFVPFVVGVTNGAPLRLVGIAVTYSDNDLCIVRNDAGISQANASDLEGMKIASPVGNVTHYKLLRTLDHLGVDASKVDVIQMNPADAAVALIRGDVPMACAFGGSLDRMRTVGSPLMTGTEQEAAGIFTFDIVTVTEEFATEHPDLVHKFLKVTDMSNRAFAAAPEEAYPVIARAAGMDVNDAMGMLANFGFPSSVDQTKPHWLGGGVQEMTRGVAEVMRDAGNLDRVLDDYSKFIDPSFLSCP